MPPQPLEALEATLREFFAHAPPEIIAAYLYGSRARGTATDQTDIDVALLYVEPPPRSLDGLPLDLEADLERMLGVPVQAIALNGAPVDLVHRVLRDGKLVLDRDRSRRIRFEVTARNEYFDLQPFLERYRAPRAAGR